MDGLELESFVQYRTRGTLPHRLPDAAHWEMEQKRNSDRTGRSA